MTHVFDLHSFPFSKGPGDLAGSGSIGHSLHHEDDLRALAAESGAIGRAGSGRARKEGGPAG